MFERYTETARRVVFYARHEAQASGSEYIEAGHFFLGLLREDPALARFFPAGVDPRAVCREVKESIPLREPGPSVDLPLSHPCKRILAYGAEEGERLNSKVIGPEHLFLGFLRERSEVGRLLEKHGVELKTVRQQIRDQSAPTREEPPAAREYVGGGGWISNDLRPGQFSSTRMEDGAVVIETHRSFQSHEIIIIERLRMSDDGKTRGPKNEHQFTIALDVS